jgi:hypothetical protein
VPPGQSARVRRSQSFPRTPARQPSEAVSPLELREPIQSAPRSPALGHNAGPRLDNSFVCFCWRKAHRAAWKTPPREVILLRLQRARELGMTYHEYTAILLDRGVRL